MRFFERSVSRAVLGACAPVALMLAGWWGSLALLGDSPWIPWAALIGRRRAVDGIRTDQALAELRIASRTAAAIMFVLCCATAWMALSQPRIGSEMRGMFGLPFTPTMNSLRAPALFGGIGLVAAEYVSTRVTANWAAGFAPSAARTGRA